MANRIVKIEDICHVVKGETGIMKAIPGEYPMVVLSEERKTHNEYQFDCKAVIIPLVSSTGHGHASMKRIHYQAGKFALGSILCALVPKKEGEYDPEYLYHILDMGKERIFVPLMKGMANVSLPLNKIKTVEINLPSYDEQVRLSKIYSEVKSNLVLLRNQTEKQHEYLNQLRQSFLKMAVKGILTEKWREENPNCEPRALSISYALKNLSKIKTGRKKFLQKVNNVIFEDNSVHQNWTKTQFFNLCVLSRGHDLPKSERMLGSYAVASSGGISGRHNEYIVEEGVVIGRSGSTGKPHYIEEKHWPLNTVLYGEDYCGNDKKFVFIFLQSFNFEKYTTQTAVPTLNRNKFLNELVLIPPIEEQKVIVDKVKQLMLCCDELEKKIIKRYAYQARIMQAVVNKLFCKEKEATIMELANLLL